MCGSIYGSTPNIGSIPKPTSNWSAPFLHAVVVVVSWLIYGNVVQGARTLRDTGSEDQHALVEMHRGSCGSKIGKTKVKVITFYTSYCKQPRI